MGRVKPLARHNVAVGYFLKEIAGFNKSRKPGVWNFDLLDHTIFHYIGEKTHPQIKVLFQILQGCLINNLDMSESKNNSLINNYISRAN